MSAAPRPPVAGGAPAHQRVLALAVFVAAAALVLLGSTVRVTDSGMGCSSWPLCNGSIGPIDHFHALLEQAHRYLAATVTVGIGALWLASRRSAAVGVRRSVAAACAIVAVQVLLGAVTVLTRNAPATVAAHLVVGLVLLATTGLVAAASFGLLPERRGRVGALEWAAVLATLLLLISGTLVVDGGAARSCPSWPWCAPHPGAPGHVVVLQLVHRAAAATAGALLVSLALRRLRRSPWRQWGRSWEGALLALLASQIGVGALDTLSRAPAALQDIHIGLAGAIWCLTVVLVVGGAGRRVGERALRAPL